TLSEDIADDYFEYLKKKEELQRELERLKFGGLKENNDLAVEKEEDKAKAETNVGIINIQELITRLQDKKKQE
ncbi:4147_t:CDS:1, partial [Dentiscutata erythropus]